MAAQEFIRQIQTGTATASQTIVWDDGGGQWADRGYFPAYSDRTQEEAEDEAEIWRDDL